MSKDVAILVASSTVGIILVLMGVFEIGDAITPPNRWWRAGLAVVVLLGGIAFCLFGSTRVAAFNLGG